MADRGDSTYRLMWMLGLALTLPMILISGPLAGFLIAHGLIRLFEWSNWLIPALMVLGLIGSGFQTFRLIQKLKRLSSK